MIRPTHLVRLVDGKLRSLCGAHGKGTGPRVGVEHAQAHIDGRAMVLCPVCVTELDRPRQLTLEDVPTVSHPADTLISPVGCRPDRAMTLPDDAALRMPQGAALGVVADPTSATRGGTR